MKIVTFWGGLGNQIIEFAYYEWLKKKCPKDKIYGFYPKAGLKSHNGLEIEKRFDVVLPPKSLLTNIWGYSLFYLDKILTRFVSYRIVSQNIANKWLKTRKNVLYTDCNRFSILTYNSTKFINTRNVEHCKVFKFRRVL